MDSFFPRAISEGSESVEIVSNDVIQRSNGFFERIPAARA